MFSFVSIRVSWLDYFFWSNRWRRVKLFIVKRSEEVSCFSGWFCYWYVNAVEWKRLSSQSRSSIRYVPISSHVFFYFRLRVRYSKVLGLSRPELLRSPSHKLLRFSIRVPVNEGIDQVAVRSSLIAMLVLFLLLIVFFKLARRWVVLMKLVSVLTNQLIT